MTSGEMAVMLSALELAAANLKHGPDGKGSAGPCPLSCAKCRVEAGIRYLQEKASPHPSHGAGLLIPDPRMRSPTVVQRPPVFQVGQRVRCIRGNVQPVLCGGGIYTITKVRETKEGVLVCVNDDNNARWNATRFELAPPEMLPPLKVGVGDLVTCVTPDSGGVLKAGRSYVVARVTNNLVEVGGILWDPRRFVLLASAAVSPVPPPAAPPPAPRWGNPIHINEAALNLYRFSHSVAIDMAEAGLASLLRPIAGTLEYLPHPKLLAAYEEAVEACRKSSVVAWSCEDVKRYLKAIAPKLLHEQPWWHAGSLPDFGDDE